MLGTLDLSIKGLTFTADGIGTMAIEKFLHTAVEGGDLNREEALQLYTEAPLYRLMEAANSIRNRLHPGKKVGWIIDRNVNITNVCFSFCRFCNFCRQKGSADAYVTSMDQYREKIRELQLLGGQQLLLQGGMHPDLKLDYYEDLFRQLKADFPDIRLHALGPPEVVHLAGMAKLSYRQTLQRLVESGLDSLPGAGAEILVDRVRALVSPAKCSTKEWLDVMRAAHQMNLPTSATMMFGHAETPAERIEHLFRIRAVQAEVPSGHYGFVNFVPWPFMDAGTRLKEKDGISGSVTGRDYLRLIAISRIVLTNIQHIQASWLTIGPDTGQIALHAGANDFGSIMIEENVVSSAGAPYQMDAKGIQERILKAGFIPYLRNQLFEALTPSES